MPNKILILATIALAGYGMFRFGTRHPGSQMAGGGRRRLPIRNQSIRLRPPSRRTALLFNWVRAASLGSSLTGVGSKRRPPSRCSIDDRLVDRRQSGQHPYGWIDAGTGSRVDTLKSAFMGMSTQLHCRIAGRTSRRTHVLASPRIAWRRGWSIGNWGPRCIRTSATIGIHPAPITVTARFLAKGIHHTARSQSLAISRDVYPVGSRGFVRLRPFDAKQMAPPRRCSRDLFSSRPDSWNGDFVSGHRRSHSFPFRSSARLWDLPRATQVDSAGRTLLLGLRNRCSRSDFQKSPFEVSGLGAGRYSVRPTFSCVLADAVGTVRSGRDLELPIGLGKSRASDRGRGTSFVPSVESVPAPTLRWKPDRSFARPSLLRCDHA